MIESIVRHCEEFIVDYDDKIETFEWDVTLSNLDKYIDYISNRLEEYYISPMKQTIYLKWKYILSYNITTI